MKRIMMAMALAVIAGAASAQNPPAAAPDSGPPGPPMMQGRGPGSPEQLRMQIEERWDHRVQTELGLNDQMMDRLRAVERANQDRETALRRHEEDLMRTVRQQLQPGVAADNSALSDALDQLAQLRVQRAQGDVQLLRDLSFLTPVQRARYVIMANQFRQLVERFRQNAIGRGMGPGMPGPRARPFQQRMQPE